MHPAKNCLKVKNKKNKNKKSSSKSSTLVATSVPNCGGESQFPVSPGTGGSGGSISNSFSDSQTHYDVVAPDSKASSGNLNNSNLATCNCSSCRTALLTSLPPSSSLPAGPDTLLTLRCHYCSTGFLVSSGKEEEEEESGPSVEKDEKATTTSSPPPFTCIDCGQHFSGGLPFITRLVGELQADIAYWAADFAARDDPEAVIDAWSKTHSQLAKLLSAGSLLLVQSSLKLAEAYVSLEKAEVEKEEKVEKKRGGDKKKKKKSDDYKAAAAKLLVGVTKVMLGGGGGGGGGYEPLESVLEKKALIAAMATAKKLIEEDRVLEEGDEEGDEFCYDKKGLFVLEKHTLLKGEMLMMAEMAAQLQAKMDKLEAMLMPEAPEEPEAPKKVASVDNSSSS